MVTLCKTVVTQAVIDLGHRQIVLLRWTQLQIDLMVLTSCIRTNILMVLHLRRREINILTDCNIGAELT